MLEYMLCRPQDAIFFGESLRAIVLDEAHLIAIAVKDGMRNSGVGHCLLFAAMDEAQMLQTRGW